MDQPNSEWKEKEKKKEKKKMVISLSGINGSVAVSVSFFIPLRPHTSRLHRHLLNPALLSLPAMR